jgi:ATP-dependent DNA helicase RecG
MLALGVYKADGDKAAYTRHLGFSSLQREQLVLNYTRQHGRIQRADVIDLCRLTEGQAKDLLKRLEAEGKLRLEGAGRRYVPGNP